MCTLKDELLDVKESLNFLHKDCDDFKKTIHTLKLVENKVATLETKIVEKDRDIKDLKNRLVNLEQYGRRNQLEISNVTVRNSEDLRQVVVDVCKHLDVTVTREDIEVVHRIKTRITDKVPTIICEMSNRRKRDEIIKNKYKKVITNATVLGSGFSQNRIYVGESLSPYFKNLLYKAKIHAKAKNYIHCWFRNNSIAFRKTDNDPLKYITCEEDLCKIN